MSTHIQDTEWIEYLDGLADREQRSRLEHHIGACAQCRLVWDATEAAGAVLAGIGSAGDDVPVSEDELRRNLKQVLGRATLTGHEQLWEHSERDRRVRRIAILLAPLCGLEGAQRMIDAAARRTGAPAVSELPAAAWPEFARHFAALASRLCGDTMGLLALEHAGI